MRKLSEGGRGGADEEPLLRCAQPLRRKKEQEEHSDSEIEMYVCVVRKASQLTHMNKSLIVRVVTQQKMFVADVFFR